MPFTAAEIAKQVGIAGTTKIGNRLTIGAQSGVMTDIPDGEQWLGTPANPVGETKRIWVGWQRLPELLDRVRDLEREVERLKQSRSA